MAGPTLVAVYGNPAPASTEVTSGATAATLSFTASWASGDWLVLVGADESGDATFNTPTATGLTFTSLGAITSNLNGSRVQMWSANPGAAGTGVTVTLSQTINAHFGVTMYQFSGATGVGTAVTKSNTTTSTDANGLAAITTTQANSAIVYIADDWTALNQTAPTYSTATAGTYTVERWLNIASAYSSYGGVYQDAGAAGAKTVGLSSGSAMRISYYTVEVLGTVGGGAIPKTERVPLNPARFRATNW